MSRPQKHLVGKTLYMFGWCPTSKEGMSQRIAVLNTVEDARRFNMITIFKERVLDPFLSEVGDVMDIATEGNEGAKDLNMSEWSEVV